MGKRGQLGGGLRMPESAAIQLCQLAFLLLGFLPVCFGIGWACLERLPAFQNYRRHTWEQALVNQIGVSASLSRVELLAPGRYRLHDIALLHPETKQAIATLSEATANCSSGQWIVRADECQLSGKQVSQLWRAGHDWLLCRPDQIQQRVGLFVSKLHITDTAQEQILDDVKLALAVSEGEPSLRVSFAGLRPAAATGGAGPVVEPTELIIRREIDSGRLATWVHLVSKEIALPCSLMSERLPQLQQLGPEAKFRGTLDWLIADDRWALWLGGRQTETAVSELSSVDFSVLTKDTAARLQGVGSIAIESAKVSERGVREISGSISVQSSVGHISSYFLRAACHFFQLQCNQELLQASSRADFPFEQLQFRFAVEPTRLTIAGAVDGSILADRHSVLVWQDSRQGEVVVPLERITMLLSYLEANDPMYRMRNEMPFTSTGLSQLAQQWLPLQRGLQVEIAGETQAEPVVRIADGSN